VPPGGAPPASSGVAQPAGGGSSFAARRPFGAPEPGDETAASLRGAAELRDFAPVLRALDFAPVERAFDFAPVERDFDEPLALPVLRDFAVAPPADFDFAEVDRFAAGFDADRFAVDFAEPPAFFAEVERDELDRFAVDFDADRFAEPPAFFAEVERDELARFVVREEPVEPEPPDRAA
jgi:hypothetical protein